MLVLIDLFVLVGTASFDSSQSLLICNRGIISVFQSAPDRTERFLPLITRSGASRSPHHSKEVAVFLRSHTIMPSKELCSKRYKLKAPIYFYSLGY